MKKLFLIFISMFTFAFGTIDSVYAVDYPFSITVIIPNSPLYFQFRLSAQGTFYVDCGTGGTLSSDNSTANGMISGGTINKTNTMIYVFKCTYSSSGTKTIRFGGTATAYDTYGVNSTLNFYVSGNNAQMITSISGNLSTIFPYISSSNGKYPRFRQTFKQSKITSIPSNLFSNITGAGTYMFYQTFQNCSKLFTFIPSTTFSGLIAKGSPTASNMWSDTFTGSALLTACPSGTSQYTTNYESSWGGKVSCEGTPAITCSSGTYLPKKTTTCTTCPTGYTCAGGTFGLNATEDQGNTPNIYVITLRNYDNTATYGTIYEKYNTGWYSDSAATNPITSAPVPTRSGYTFRGFYTATQSDITANGGSGTRLITNSGGLSSNKRISENTYLYAAWAKNCAAGTGCTCNLSLEKPGISVGTIADYSSGIVTYTTTPNTGYTITSGFGTYAPACTKSTINMTFDGVATTPSQCTYGGTFSVPPTPAPRTGYIFTGWKVKTVHPQTCGIETLDSSINNSGGNNGMGSQDLNGNIWGVPSKYALATGSGEWAAEFSYGTIWGKSRCSSTVGDHSSRTWPESSKSNWQKMNPANDNGTYCWCQVTGFAASGNDYTSGPRCFVDSASYPWVFYYANSDYSGCASSCAKDCGYAVAAYDYFRGPLFRALE